MLPKNKSYFFWYSPCRIVVFNEGNLHRVTADMKSEGSACDSYGCVFLENLKSIYKEETMKKKTMKVDFSLVDTEGRRQKIDRRQFTYLTHIPERRCGKDRRSTESSGSSKVQRRFADVMANPDHPTD